MKRAHLVTAIAVAVVLGLVLLFALRVEPVFAIAWAVLAGVLVLCAQVAVPDDPRSDAPDLSVDRERRGTDIARMAWSLNPRTGEAGALITRRVRSTLRLRLKRRGLDAENPADLPRIDALLGPGLWARLNGPGTTVGDIEHALGAIDALPPEISSTARSSGDDGNRTGDPRMEKTQ